jgi:hypothetical protein
MKRLAIAALVFVVLLAGVAAAAVIFVDVDALSKKAQTYASDALGQPIAFGEVGLVVFPPAVRATAIKVGGAGGKPALAEVEELRLALAIVPLFAGKVVLRAVELDAPKIHLEVDKDGKPIIPEFGKPKTGAEPAPAPTPEEPSGESAPLSLAVNKIAISNGQVDVGPWRVEGLDVSGDLELGGSGDFQIEAGLGDLGRIEDLEVALEGIGEPTMAIDAKGQLRDLNIAVLNQRLALVPPAEGQLAGLVSGPFTARVRGEAVEGASAQLVAGKLDVSMGDLRLSGDVPIDVELGTGFKVDLTNVAIAVGEALRKPAGDRLTASGPLAAVAGPAALSRVDLAIGPNALALDVDLAAKRPQVVVQPATFDLAPLRPWLVGEDIPDVKGAIVLEQVTAKLDPLAVVGNLALRDVAVPLEHGVVVLSGPIKAAGSKITGDGLQVGIGPEKAQVAFAYDLDAGTLSLDTAVKEANVANLAQVLAGSQEITGTLLANAAVSGKPALETLAGGGEFAITKGQIKGFSLARQLFGQLADVAKVALEQRGKDISRFEQEEFERLEGRFRLADGRVRVEPLRLVYRSVRAELAGDVNLVDSKLDLAGTIVLAGEVDEELGGRGEDREIRGARIGCEITKPCLRVDPGTLVRFAALYSVTGGKLGEKLGEKLEEKFGKEGGEAVRGVLDQLLRGGKKPEPSEPKPQDPNQN